MQVIQLAILLACLCVGAQATISTSEYNKTWAMSAQWDGTIEAGVARTLKPVMQMPPGLVATIALAGNNGDGSEKAILSFICSGLGKTAKTYMTMTYGIAVRNLTFPYGGECEVTIDNSHSTTPLSTFFLLTVIDSSKHVKV